MVVSTYSEFYFWNFPCNIFELRWPGCSWNCRKWNALYIEIVRHSEQDDEVSLHPAVTLQGRSQPFARHARTVHAANAPCTPPHPALSVIQ